MPGSNKNLLDDVAGYYTQKLAQHGVTPRGADWNGEESQTLRFEQLCKVITSPANFSLNDLGCGYGALYDFLCPRYKDFSYFGLDISEDMIRSAKQRCAGVDKVGFIHSSEPDRVADYSIASGIFNVRLGRSDSEWQTYMHATLNMLNHASRIGFAFNCLTSYSDPEKMRDYLYYPDPCAIFDHCKRHYARDVALLHDYGLYEFTILVRKPL